MSYWWPFRSRYLPLTFGKRALLLFIFLSCLTMIWYFGVSEPIKFDYNALNSFNIFLYENE